MHMHGLFIHMNGQFAQLPVGEMCLQELHAPVDKSGHPVGVPFLRPRATEPEFIDLLIATEI